MKINNTKKIILQKSLDFFSTHGFTGASVRKIANAVGVRESALYNHFKSKEEIFLSLLEEFRKKSIGISVLSDDLLDELDNHEKFLKDFVKRLIDHWSKPEERKFIRLLLMEQFTRIGSQVLSVSDYLVELRSICSMILTEMMKAGVIIRLDSKILTEEFIAPLFLLRTEKIYNCKKY